MREKLAALRQKIGQAKAASFIDRAALAGAAVEDAAALLGELVAVVEDQAEAIEALNVELQARINGE